MCSQEFPVCEVCLNEYNEDRQSRVLHCGHTLCVECLASIMSTNNKCATCRAVIPDVVISRNIQLEDAISYIKEHVEPEMACASCKETFQVKSMMMCVSCLVDKNPGSQKNKTVPMNELPFCTQCLVEDHVKIGHVVHNYEAVHEHLCDVLEENQVVNGRVKKQWIRDVIGMTLLDVELEKQKVRLQEKKEVAEGNEKRKGACDKCHQALPGTSAPLQTPQPAALNPTVPLVQMQYAQSVPYAQSVAHPQAHYANQVQYNMPLFPVGHAYQPTLNLYGVFVDEAGRLIQEGYDGNNWMDVPNGCRYVRFSYRPF